MRYILLLLISFIVLSCNTLIDEELPLTPENIQGYFTINNYSPRVHLYWEGSSSDDISEYHIFRELGDDISYYSLGKVSHPYTMYTDTSIGWDDIIEYKIRAEDHAGNISLFSDVFYIHSYKPAGRWEIQGFDSLYLCIDPITYSASNIFRIVLNENLDSIGDTLIMMDFVEVILDSNNHTGQGWMYYSYSVLEYAGTIDGYDTVTYSNVVSPSYYTINLSEPDSGIITFESGMYEPFYLNHTEKYCSGGSILP